MGSSKELELTDYLEIARRRLWVLVVPAVVVPLLAYAISLRIPNRYTSQTLVLVEQQKVPDNFVKSNVAEDMNRRLLTMQDQILSRTRLEPIILKYDLYREERRKAPMEDVLDVMRREVSVTALKGDPSVSRGVPGYYISFTANSPRVAQLVCAEITSLFIAENLKARRQSAEGTTEFLASQLDEAKRKLDDQDRALASFKSQYMTQLPERDTTNLAMLSTLNSQLDALTQGITQAEQQKTYMQSLLSQQVAAWKATQMQGTGAPDDLERRRAILNSELLNLQSKYTPDHPDVIKAQQALAQLEKKIADANAAIAEGKVTPIKTTAVEPAEIGQLRASIRQIEDGIKSKSKDQERVQKDIRTYEARLQMSPIVEEQYKKLTRDYQTAQAFYDDLLSKRKQSEMATELERQQQGEQFHVQDPPNLPEKPSSPDRLKFVLGGFAIGLVIGCGIATLLEFRDQSLRTEKDVIAALELPVLATIPVLNEEHETEKSSRVYGRA